MSVINHEPLKIRDEHGNGLSVLDDGTAARPRITLGFDLRAPNAVVSMGAELSLVDAIQVRNELNRLINRHAKA